MQVQVFRLGYRFEICILTRRLNLHLTTRTRDLRAETWNPKLFLGWADHPWSAAVEQGSSTLPKAITPPILHTRYSIL
ncbi:MAG: hypothetical protein EBV31_07550 [Verrucomicrobia bacterium]|nr:hypothetical protein [Verrucomicrobiota bacterium]